MGARVRTVAGDEFSAEQLEVVARRLMHAVRAEQHAGTHAAGALADSGEAAREAAAEAVGGVGGWTHEAAGVLLQECEITFRIRVIRVMAEIEREAAMAGAIVARRGGGGGGGARQWRQRRA